MLQGPFKAHGFGRGSAAWLCARSPRTMACGSGPPRRANPAPCSPCLPKRVALKCCELLHDPALLDKPPAPLLPLPVSCPITQFPLETPSLAPAPRLGVLCASPNAGTGGCCDVRVSILQTPPRAIWLLGECSCLHRLPVSR